MKIASRLHALKRETHTRDHLPYTRHITDTIISLRNGRMMVTLELEGISFETSDQTALNDLHTKLNLLWRNVNDERLALWSHIIRIRDNVYPDGHFQSDFARKLDDKYKSRMTGEKLYRNRLFLSLVFVPARGLEKMAAFASRLRSARKQSVEINEKALRDFQTIIPTVIASLERYKVHSLKLYEKDGFIYSEINEYLNALGALNFIQFPLVHGPINGAILLDRPLFGREVIELRGAGSSRFAGIFGIKEYPAITRPGMLDSLLKAPFEFLLTQSFSMSSKAESRTILTRKQNQMTNAGDRALSQIDDLDIAIDDLESNRMTMGRHHLNLMVVAPDTKTLMEHMATAQRYLTDGNIISAREDLALEAAYWSQFPGNFQHRPRSGHITSRNFASLSPFHSYPKGELTCEWGQSIALLKTPAGCGFHLNLHVGDLGNTFICGPSGSGKTVLQNFILAQLQKHDVTTVFFDKDRGAELFVRAMDGTYLALKNRRPTGCAPLKMLNLDDPAQHDFAVKWATKLVYRPDKPLSVQESQEIEKALLQLRNLPQHQRTIGALRAFLGQRDPEGIGARMERWMSGSANGWVFDNDRDELDLEAKLIGFDMTDFLDDAEIRTPLMMYLFYRIERLIDGRRIVIDIDEFWKALADEAFRDLAQNKLKTIRKQNGLMIFGTQSPADAIKSPIGYTIIEQCPTKIFMPNAYAQADDYMNGFGLTSREFQLIKDELTIESRQFLIKQEHNSVVAELSLHGFDDELTILSGRTTTVNRLDEIRAQMGNDPKIWMPILLNKTQTSKEYSS